MEKEDENVTEAITVHDSSVRKFHIVKINEDDSVLSWTTFLSTSLVGRIYDVKFDIRHQILTWDVKLTLEFTF